MTRKDNGGFERRVQSFLMAGLMLLCGAIGGKMIYVGEAIATLQAQGVASAAIITEMRAELATLKIQATTAAALAAQSASRKQGRE